MWNSYKFYSSQKTIQVEKFGFWFGASMKYIHDWVVRDVVMEKHSMKKADNIRCGLHIFERIDSCRSMNSCYILHWTQLDGSSEDIPDRKY